MMDNDELFNYKTDADLQDSIDKFSSIGRADARGVYLHNCINKN